MKPILVLKGIKKYFPGTKALDWSDDDVLEIYPGQIHGIVGENGAGKSTLVKIIMGIYHKTAGEVYLNDKIFYPRSALEAEEKNVSIIMQQPNILLNLTVAENIFIGRDSKFIAKNGLLKIKKQNEEAKKILDELGFTNINPSNYLNNLDYEGRKLVEIARAISVNPKILIVDETSAAVSHDGVEKLYKMLKEQRKNGVAIIYISHFINEVFELCDNISILRDGKYIKSLKVKETTQGEVISNMVGREINKDYYRENDAVGNVGEKLIEIKNLSKEGAFSDVTFSVSRGEILGIGGIGGCGVEELGRILFGGLKPDSGDIIYKGKRIHFRSTNTALKNGIGYVPKDREKEGLVVNFTIRENVSSSSIKNLSNMGFINKKMEKDVVEKSVKALRVKANSIEETVESLSGGNRQKVAIAKWVSNDSELLIMNSPTRGVDVAAKQEIYKFIENLKNQGKAIILISDELPELIGMSDRIMIMRKGKITGTFSRDEHPGEHHLIQYMV
ncbi:MAG: sugar ABC transporter ATP-binding protein [Eubacteriales bacterium]|nr:sugar ABC transporter ATP-binding protein [Eubacteriales bacterium]